MVGLFDFTTSIKTRMLTLGYRTLKPIKTTSKSRNLTLQGHEFHYSTFSMNNELPAWKSSLPKKGVLVKDGFNIRNCHAFYTHIYWASNREWLNHLADS